MVVLQHQTTTPPNNTIAHHHIIITMVAARWPMVAETMLHHPTHLHLPPLHRRRRRRGTRTTFRLTPRNLATPPPPRLTTRPEEMTAEVLLPARNDRPTSNCILLATTMEGVALCSTTISLNGSKTTL